MPPEEALLRGLIAVGSQRASRAEELRKLFGACDPATLRATFDRDRLVPIAGTRLQDLLEPARSAWLDDWVQSQVAVLEQATKRNDVVTAFVLGALAGAGIRAVPLKGPSLARELFGDVALRSSGDIDVLVAPQDLFRTVGLLTELGWSAPHDRVDKAGYPALHFELAHPVDLPSVDVHWRLHFYEREWARGLVDRATGPPADLRLAEDDLLSVLLLLYARDGFSNLRLAADVAGWWDRYGGTRRPAVANAMAEAPALRRALATAAVVADAQLGVPAAAVLGSTTRSHAHSRLVARLAGAPLPQGIDQRLSERRIAEILMAPRSGILPAARRWVLPAHTSDGAKDPPPGSATAGVRRAATKTRSLLVRGLLTTRRLWRAPQPRAPMRSP